MDPNRHLVPYLNPILQSLGIFVLKQSVFQIFIFHFNDLQKHMCVNIITHKQHTVELLKRETAYRRMNRKPQAALSKS